MIENWLRQLRRFLIIVSLVGLIGGGAWFLRGMHLTGLVDSNGLLDSDAWDEQGLELLVAGGVTVCISLLALVLIRIERLLDLLKDQQQASERSSGG